MKLYLLEPEVAGGFGKNSIITFENNRIKDVKHLHYVFEGWLGDDVLTSSPCFIITSKLADAISNSGLKGYELRKIEISLSDNFMELYPNRQLPEFLQLVPIGIVTCNGNTAIEWSGHDICLSDKVDLIISENALEIFNSFKLSNCEIRELSYISD